MIQWRKPKTESDETDDDGMPLKTVPFVPWACPRCGKCRTETYSQSRGKMIRWHRCQSCGQKFKSQQVQPEELRSLPRLRGLHFGEN